MAKKDNMVLTSVKLPGELFEEFKVECVRTKFSIQKLIHFERLLTTKKNIKNNNTQK